MINQEKLNEILQKHSDWLDDIEGGVQADLRGANLRYVNLRYVNLRGANLIDAKLNGVYLHGANLSGANLRGVDLQFADLRGANLIYANLRHANLRHADLRSADLRGADLEDANLYGANLEGSRGIIHWQSPVGIKRACYSVKHDNCVMHKLGCFYGNTDKAVTAIREKYGDDSLYEQLLLLNTKALEEE
jgi:hypothetical protein